MLRAAAKRNPERDENEPHIEPESLLARVKAIEPEFVAAWHIARGVYLRDAGQARTETGPFNVAGDFVHRYQFAVRRRFDFAWTQRAWTDEAHVTPENIPELRELVHRGRAHQSSDASDSRVVFRRLHGAHARLRVRNHRSKLEHREDAPAFAHAVLCIEHWSAVLDF